VPGIDLVLELFDGQGRRLAKSDTHGRGEGEWLQPTSIGPTDAYFAVREVWVEGQKPTENPNDAYVLTAGWNAPRPGWEVEPNDWEAGATPLNAGQAMRGYLPDGEDKDWYAITPAASGKLLVRVRPPAEVDAVLLTAGEGGKAPANRAINRQGAGGEEELSVDVAAGRPLLIGVARKAAQPREARENKKDPKEQPPKAVDQPYDLSTDMASEER
jgi:hypothetical protein